MTTSSSTSISIGTDSISVSSESAVEVTFEHDDEGRQWAMPADAYSPLAYPPRVHSAFDSNVNFGQMVNTWADEDPEGRGLEVDDVKSIWCQSTDDYNMIIVPQEPPPVQMEYKHHQEFQDVHSEDHEMSFSQSS
jgi:hypothetical protein